MRTNYTSPPNLLDIFDLTSGVTIHENGKSKAAVVKKNNLNEKGRLRMNKTEYYQMSQKSGTIKPPGRGGESDLKSAKSMMKTSPVGNTFSAFGKGIGSKTAKQTDQMMATAGKDTTMYDTIGGDAEDTQTDFGKTIKVNST